ncbi:MAG: DUF3168 domain-containing protein [Pseudomonadota bacterium]
MADGLGTFVSPECRLQAAVLAGLRADPDVREIYGDPARVYDDETRGPAYPYATLERHESRPAGAADCIAREHTLTFAVTSRYGGRAYAKDALGALRSAIERMDIAPEGQTVVLAYTTYGDVFRTQDRQAFRGVIRIRIISEETG